MNQPTLRPRNSLPLSLFALLPTALFYASFLARYGHTLLLRRDENIVLMLVDELAHGSSVNDLFALVLSPAFLVLLHALAPLVAPIVLGRVIGMLSALACAALTALIARRLSASALVPPLTLALMLSSALFVGEGTQIRLDLPSLAVALGGVALLLDATPLNRPWGRPLLAGLLFGIAIQLKPLALMLVPFALYILWRVHGFPHTRRDVAAIGPAVVAHVFGWLLPGIALLTLPGLGGTRLLGALAAHAGTSARIGIDIRLAHTIATAVEFVAGHFWLVVAFALALYRSLRLRASDPTRGDALLLAVWAGCVVAALLVSFPTWDHHYVYLLPPLSIGAALLLHAIGQSLFAGAARRSANGLLLLCLAISITGVLGAEAALPAQQIPPEITDAAAHIHERVAPDALVWSDDGALPLLAGRRTDPELIDLSMKRVLAGELRQSDLFRLFAQRPPAAVAVYDGLFTPYAAFIRCLQEVSTAEPIAPGSKTLYWVRPADAPRLVQCGAAP